MKNRQKLNRRKYFFYLILFLIAAFISGVYMFFSPLNNSKGTETFVQWGVSSGHPLATLVGMDVLEQGGNAVDAAVAVAYALGVVEPYACSLGGGGEMMLYWKKEKKISVFDYRETAPFTSSNQGYLSVTGVPGFVKGMDTVLKKYGTLPRMTLMNPAIEYASNGIPVSKTLAHLIDLYQNNKLNSVKNPEFFLNGRPLKTGEYLYQYELAQQLNLIAKYGSTAFYSGLIANSNENSTNQSSLPFSPSDIQKYQVLETKAIKSTFHDYSIFSVPPPGGGMTLIEMLRLAEISRASDAGMTEERKIPLLLKGMAISYQDRRRYLGDPRFSVKPYSFLNQQGYLARRWGNFKNNFGLATNDEEQSTTHFVIVDRWGNWVSSTQTIGDFFGSGMETHGFFLNNSLNKFTNDKDSPNARAPGKRPFSYMAPSLIFKSNIPVLALGSPGGRRIPAILTQALIYHLVDGLNIEDACRHARFYLAPGKYVFFEKKPPATVYTNLRRNKFQIVIGNNNLSYGSIQALGIDEKSGRLVGAADPRREGDYECVNLKKLWRNENDNPQ